MKLFLQTLIPWSVSWQFGGLWSQRTGSISWRLDTPAWPLLVHPTNTCSIPPLSQEEKNGLQACPTGACGLREPAFCLGRHTGCRVLRAREEWGWRHQASLYTSTQSLRALAQISRKKAQLWEAVTFIPILWMRLKSNLSMTVRYWNPWQWTRVPGGNGQCLLCPFLLLKIHCCSPGPWQPARHRVSNWQRIVKQRMKRAD